MKRFDGAVRFLWLIAATSEQQEEPGSRCGVSTCPMCVSGLHVACLLARLLHVLCVCVCLCLRHASEERGRGRQRDDTRRRGGEEAVR